MNTPLRGSGRVDALQIAKPSPSGANRFRAVFLDRDGTLNKKASNGPYILSPEEVELLPGAGNAVKRLKQAGLSVFVVSNQRAVALSAMTVVDLERVNGRVQKELRAFGADIDGFYMCTHHVGSCDCRKPAPGLLEQAIRDHPEVDRSRSVVVGDEESDVGAGRAAGMTTIRLCDGPMETDADWTAMDLAAAVDMILTA